MSLAAYLLAVAVAPAVEWKAVVDPLARPVSAGRPAVGLVVGVWANGRAYAFGYGTVTTPTGDRVPDADTLFEIGSVTKAFTGVLLADAVGRKEVALTDPVNRHLPPDLHVRRKTDRPITLHHLATHRSGLPVQPPLIGLTARDPANPYADFTRPRLAAVTSRLTPGREPGAKYEYSNLGVGLLGHALAHAAGADGFDALVRDRVCRPLGLRDTGEALTGRQKARLAAGQSADGKPTASWDFATLEACGGLRSSAADLLRFAAANVGDVPTPLAAVLRASHARQAATDAADEQVGLCWHRSKSKGGADVVWHNGGTGGYRAMLAFTPAGRRAVVVLAATADPAGRVDRLALDVLARVQPK